MTEPSLVGKVAVVTGGSRGIGYAVASLLVSAGADVVIGARSVGELETASHRLRAGASGPEGGRVEPVGADVREPTQVELLLERAVERFGGLDILINNAGVGIFRELSALSVEDWRTVIDTNLSSVFFACRAAIPLLRQRGGGWIVNVSSLAGAHPFSGGAAYCASKAGLDALTEVLMQEVRYDNIRVSSVAPGSVQTSFDAASDASASSRKLAPQDVGRAILDLLGHHPRSLPSRLEIRPSQPRRSP